MRFTCLRWPLLLPVMLCLAGCAAMITRSEPDEPELLQVGTTEAQLTRRLGPPLQSRELSPPRQALALWEDDRQVSLLLSRETVVSESAFSFKGRRDRALRMAQAGFDSFMTLGLAELYLIPKALWERAIDERLLLRVWFGADRRALAFKWEPLPDTLSVPRGAVRDNAGAGP